MKVRRPEMEGGVSELYDVPLYVEQVLGLKYIHRKESVMFLTHAFSSQLDHL